MAARNGVRTRQEIEDEIKITNVSLHAQYNDTDARNFYQGRLSALRWALKLET